MEPIADRIKKLVKDLESNDSAVLFKAENELERLAEHAGGPDKTKAQADIAAALAAVLDAVTTVKDGDKTRSHPTYPPYARSHLCRCLSYVGGEAEVPALQKAMEDLNVREMARFALERNPSAAATKALIAALEAMGTDFRIGVINALAQRKAPDAQKALVTLTQTCGGEVQVVAAEALACFPDPTLDAVISTAAKADAPRAKVRTEKARIRLAGTLSKAGKKSGAGGIYKRLNADCVTPAQRKAAEIGEKSEP